MATNAIRVNRIQDMQHLIPVQSLERVVNLTLSGLQTIDGYTLLDGDRIFASSQTTSTEDGIYIAHSGAWERAFDVEIGRDLHGALFYVENGTVNGESTFAVNSLPAIVGTNNLTVLAQGGVASLGAENGLHVDAGVVKAGGQLTENTWFQMFGNDFSATSVNGASPGGSISFESYAGSFSAWSGMVLTPNRAELYFNNAANGLQRLRMNDADGMVIHDANKSMGLVNDGDYETNFIPRSLITKQYVDGLVGGRSWKQPVVVCIDGVNVTGNIDLTTNLVGQTVDGRVLVAGDRIALFDQTTNTENGIYDVVAGAGNSTRSVNFETGAEARNYTFFASQGTVNADVEFSVANDKGSDIVGTDDLVLAQTGSASQITAGAGMVRNTNAFDVVSADLSLLVNADDMQVNIGSTNGNSLEVSATGLELAGTITGARTFEDVLTLGTGATNFVLPNTRGTDGQVLKTDATGTVTWQDDGQTKVSPQPEDVFTGDGATTIFTMTNLGTHATVKALYVEVYYEGQLLFGTTGAVGTNDYGYNADTGQITLADAPLVGDTLQIKHFSQDA